MFRNDAAPRTRPRLATSTDGTPSLRMKQLPEAIIFTDSSLLTMSPVSRRMVLALPYFSSFWNSVTVKSSLSKPVAYRTASSSARSSMSPSAFFRMALTPRIPKKMRKGTRSTSPTSSQELTPESSFQMPQSATPVPEKSARVFKVSASASLPRTSVAEMRENFLGTSPGPTMTLLSSSIRAENSVRPLRSAWSLRERRRTSSQDRLTPAPAFHSE
mmetsp:Transcript_69335/g.206467  ORF Transcript_69335/g.206467 Transcript_69335/m.206467 type:complete len:216 (+) Transcript_69335:217-864(+)